MQTFNHGPWYLSQRAQDQGKDQIGTTEKHINHKSTSCQPSVKFYGKEGKRHATILDHDKASLPLRLTGEGVSFDFALSVRIYF